MHSNDRLLLQRVTRGSKIAAPINQNSQNVGSSVRYKMSRFSHRNASFTNKARSRYTKEWDRNRINPETRSASSKSYPRKCFLRKARGFTTASICSSGNCTFSVAHGCIFVKKPIKHFQEAPVYTVFFCVLLYNTSLGKGALQKFKIICINKKGTFVP